MSYLRRLREVLQPALNQLDFDTLGQHNAAYRRLYADRPFYWFVQVEWPYYSRVLDWYRRRVPRGARVLEVGTFIPVMPLLLRWEGYNVTTIERLDFYGDALLPLIELVEKMGVDFIDADVMRHEFDHGAFDVVNLLAVLEHLQGSPRDLLHRIQGWLRPAGAVVVVVPNHARLANRLGLFLLGRSTHPEFRDYFASSYPFTGHRREYTFAELRYALSESGYRVEELSSIRYPPGGGLLKGSVEFVAGLLPRTFHHGIFAVARVPQ